MVLGRTRQIASPYRSWFSTGIYLMGRGEYKDGAITGDWIECSRFETCVHKNYTNDPVP